MQSWIVFSARDPSEVYLKALLKIINVETVVQLKFCVETMIW